jgi:hypothetical protein
LKTKANKPKFVLYHSLQVHHPFQKDDNNSDRIDELMRNLQSDKNNSQSIGSVGKNRMWMKNYLEQVNIANKKTIKNVSLILQYDPNCIILILSDHGFRLITDVSTNDAREESYSNFCAVFNHQGKQNQLEKLQTPTEIVKYTLDSLLL